MRLFVVLAWLIVSPGSALKLGAVFKNHPRHSSSSRLKRWGASAFAGAALLAGPGMFNAVEAARAADSVRVGSIPASGFIFKVPKIMN